MRSVTFLGIAILALSSAFAFATPGDGQVHVTINPADAVTAGGQWKLDSGSTWRDSGATITGVIVGSHTVSFKDITDWSTPTSQTISVSNSVTTNVSGTYVAHLHAVRVTITPAGANTAGATWQLDGAGDWHTSGESVDTTPGAHYVSFSSVAGYGTPATQQVDVPTNGTAAVEILAVYKAVVYVDMDNSSGTEDGTSWATAYRDLQAAFDYSNATTEAWVAEGTYTHAYDDGAPMASNGSVYGGFAGTETTREQRNWTTHVVTIDGQNARRCVKAANNALLDGFTLQNGTPPGGEHPSNVCGALLVPFAVDTFAAANCSFSNNAGGPEGGAIYSNHASLTITNCSFTGNLAIEGGAIKHTSTGGTMLLKDCTFTSNVAAGGYYNCGGAITVLAAPVVVDSCAFLNNTAQNGGAIFTQSGVNMEIGTSLFEGNSSEYGGAIYQDDGTIYLDASTFNNNQCSTLGGGIFFINNNTGTQITGCTFEGNNSGTGQGAAIHNRSASPRITSCLFKNNVSGAGAIAGESSASPITNCVFTGNTCPSNYGTAIFAYQCSYTLTNCTLYNNATPAYCDLNHDSNVVVKNCIAWGSSPQFSPTILTMTYSDVVESYPGEGNISTVPAFSNPANDDFRLVVGSPGIDAGTATGAPATDFLGVYRPQGGAVDMGAYEGAVDGGTLLVTIEPAGAITAGAKWSIDGGAIWHDSGASVPAAVHSYTVTYKTVFGWDTPSDESVTVAKDAPTTTTGTYVQQFGSVHVVINPEGAAAAGAEWSIDGGTTRHLSDATATLVPIGDYTLSFKVMGGWNTPANQAITVTKNTTTEATGTYQLQIHAVQVTITPSTAVEGGAKWQLDDDGVWHDSGQIVGVTPGAHTVTFQDIPGWGTPVPQTVSIGAADTAAAVINAKYLPILRVDMDQTSGSADGLTWNTAFPTIQQAVDAAPGGAEIWIAEGRYIGQGAATIPVVTLVPMTHLIGGFIGLGEGGQETQLDQRDWNMHETIISGEGTRRCVTGDADMYLDGLAIVLGKVTEEGAGVYCAAGPATVSNCIMAENTCGWGGGMFYDDYAEPLTVTHCRFTNNRATDTWGSGVGLGCESNGLFVDDCVFANNTATQSGYGVGLYANINDDGPATITRCMFLDNMALADGAGAGFEIDYGNPVIMDNCIAAGNVVHGSSGAWGVGGYITSATEVRITNSTFSSNVGQAESHGGGLTIDSTTSATIESCSFDNNNVSEGHGGALCNYAALVDVKNSVFVNNSGLEGGAAYNKSWDLAELALTDFVNCTFMDNFAGSGNGNSIFDANFAHSSAVNSILWGATENHVYGEIAGITFSDIQGPLANSGNLSGATPAASNISADPKFIDDAQSDLRLMGASPCIDSGTVVGAPSVDILGVARPQGNSVDLGAYEVNYATLKVALQPFDAILAGAAWNVNSEPAWHANNACLQLDPGSYDIGFKPVAGWIAPDTQTQALAVGENAELTGTYVKLVYAVTVDTTPGGGRWMLDNDGVWRDSGETVDTTAGTHTVSFEPIPGYDAPAPQTIEIGAENTAPVPVTGAYRQVVFVDVDNTSGTQDGASWATAYTSLQAGVNAASGRDVWVAEGTYTGSSGLTVVSMEEDVRVYGGFAGDETYISQRDWNAHSSVVDGENSYRCVTANNNNLFDGLTLTRGGGWGGGLALQGYGVSNLTVKNCTLVGTVSNGSGPMSLTYMSGDVRVVDCVFADNQIAGTSGGDSGAILVLETPDVRLEGCTFTNNTGYLSGAFGIQRSSVIIEDCDFDGNSSPYYQGGAINFLGNNVGTSALTVHNSRFTGNTSPYGGGIFVDLANTVEVTECTFSGNTAPGYIYGGAIAATRCNSVDISGSYFLDNVGNSGGAVSFENSTATMTNCVVARNSATSTNLFDSSGALNTANSALSLLNCTFFQNTTGTPSVGGASLRATSGSSISAANCIFWDTQNSFRVNDSTLTVTYSDIRGGYAGEGNIADEPFFSHSLANNFSLVAGSAAIDVGNDAVAPGVDIMGIVRPQGAHVDMGAYEGAAAAGSVSASILPTAVVDAGAQWSLDGGVSWYDSDDTLDSAGANTQILSFKPVYGWDTPPDQYIEVNSGQLTLAQGEYVRQYGYLQANIQPAEAVEAGALWGLAGGDISFESGESVQLPVQDYQVQFATISGWNAPGDQTVSMVKDNTSTLSVFYIRQVHAVQVQITPPELADAGIQWQVDGDGAWYSASDLVNVEPGEHTITFTDVPGLTTPPPYIIYVPENATAPVTVRGQYLPLVFVDAKNTSGIEDGASWDTAYSSLDMAANTANLQGGAEIWVGEGTYIGSDDRVASFAVPIRLYGGFIGNGQDGYETNRDQRDALQHPVMIDGENYRPCLAFATDVLVDGCNIVNGSANDTYGGGIRAELGVMTFTNCTFRNNYAGDGHAGAGLFCSEPENVRLTDCLFIENLNDGGDGAGLFVGWSPTVFLDDCTFSSNTNGYDESSGAGAYIYGDHVRMTNCRFEANTAQYNTLGVSLALYGSGVLTDCLFTGSHAGEESYGAVKLEQGNWSLIRCSFADNVLGANSRGSGLSIRDGEVTLDACVFDGNLATGGKGSVCIESDAAAAFTNCVFLNNTSGSGGAVYSMPTSGASFMNCTFQGNTAEFGNGQAVYSEGGMTPVITNSILWGDLDNQVYGEIAGITFSDISGPLANTGNLSGAIEDASNIHSDPLFVDAATGNLGLAEGSPCVDAGTDAGAPAVDFIGTVRPQGDGMDMGAFEFFATMEGEPLEGQTEGQPLEGQTEGQIEGQSEGEPVEGGLLEGQPLEGEPVEGGELEGQPLEGEPVEGGLLEGQAEGEPVEGGLLEGQAEGELEGEVEGQPLEGEPVEGSLLEGEPLEGQAEGEAEGQTEGEILEGEPLEGALEGEAEGQPLEGDLEGQAEGQFEGQIEGETEGEVPSPWLCDYLPLTTGNVWTWETIPGAMDVPTYRTSITDQFMVNGEHVWQFSVLIEGSLMGPITYGGYLAFVDGYLCETTDRAALDTLPAMNDSLLRFLPETITEGVAFTMDGVQELLTGLEISEGVEMIPHFEGGMLYLNDIPVLQLGLGFALVSPTERTLVGSCEDGWTDIEGEPSEGEILEGQTEGQSEGQAEGETIEGEQTEGETVEGEAIEGQPVEGAAPEGQPAEGDVADGETPADGEPAEGDAGEGQSQTQEGDTPAPSKGCFGA